MSIYSIRREKNKQTLKKYIMYLVLAMAFFIPLSPSFATIALVIGIVVVAWRFFLHRKLKFAKLPLDTPIVIFAVISLLSCAVSPDRFFSFYNCTHTLGIYILVYILIGQSIETSEDIKHLLFAIFAGFLACVSYGFYQALFGISASDITWVDPNAFPELKKRIFSTWENPNIFAGFLAMMLSLFLGLLAKSKAQKEKAIYAALIIAGAIALLLTYSRGAMLSVFAVFLIFGAFYDKRIIFFSILAAVCFLAINPLALERIASVFTTVDTSTEMRFAFYEATIAMIEDHPLLGCGWGAYFMTYPEYDFYLMGAPVKIVHAHNIYLNYAAEVGIIGAIAFFWFFFGAMKLAFSGKDGEDEATDDEVTNDEILTNEHKAQNIEKTPVVAEEKESVPQNEEKLAEIARFIALLKLIGENKKDAAEAEQVAPVEEYAEILPETKEAVKEKRFNLAEFLQEPIFKDNDSIREGLSLGVGLVFLSVALNGLFDDLLFNIPTSMFLWLLAALVAKNSYIRS